MGQLLLLSQLYMRKREEDGLLGCWEEFTGRREKHIFVRKCWLSEFKEIILIILGVFQNKSDFQEISNCRAQREVTIY